MSHTPGVASGSSAPGRRVGGVRLVRSLGATARGEAWTGLLGEVPVEVEVATRLPAGSPEAAALANAARAAARLQHRAIGSVLEVGQLAGEGGADDSPGPVYVVTEHLPGGPLATLETGWAWPGLARLLDALLGALAHAHARGWVHERIHPGLVRLCGAGDLHGGVKLTGFALALLDPPDAGEFLAPEQTASDTNAGESVGPWTDLYALGCLGWWAATGRSPFGHAGGRARIAAAHRGERPPDFVPRYLVPVELEAWLRTLLHKDPDRRWRTAADARAAFARIEVPLAVDVEGVVAAAAAPAGTGRPPGDEPAPPDVAALPEDWREDPPGRAASRLRAAGLATLTTRELPLFGRERQRELLWKGLRGVHEEGKPRVVVVRGPSGVGKTRLVEWVSQRAAELGGVPTLWVRGDDLTGALTAHLGLVHLDSPELVRHVVERLGGDRAAESLAQILVAGLTAGDDETGPAPEGWRGALRRLVELESARRPALLVVDDAHEADEALELARELATPSDRFRRAVLVVLIAREDDGLAERPEVENRIAGVLQVARAKIVHLEALEPGARKALFAWLGLTDALAARVDERSKGNPQFALQLLEDWLGRGALVGGPEGLRLVGHEEPPMPDDLHEAWSARVLQILHTLPGIAGIHLERAAALGMEVDQAEWDVACDDPAHGRVSEAGGRLRAQLVARLREARLLHEAPRGFRFAHPMLRESVERISRKAGRWASHHQAIATYLESLERPDPARVGVHWLEAGEPLRAIDPLFAGIERGMRRSGIAQVAAALLPLERALREAAVPPDDLRWARLYSRQATVLRRRGLLIAAGDLAEKARALADRPGADTVWSECTRELGRILHERGDVPGALAMLQQTAARLLRAGARGTELTIVLTRMSVLGRMMNALDDAERWATQAHGIIARAEIEDPALEGSIIGELAVIAARRGNLERAFELFDEATRHLRRGSATPRLAEVENNRGDALKRAGRWDEAEAAFLEATRLQELLGTAPEIPKLNLAMCRLHAGRYAEARAVADEVVRGAATRINATLALVARSVCDGAAGDFGPSARDLEPAFEVLRRAKLVDPDAAWLAEQGARLAVEAGATQVARAYATFAREQYEALGDGVGVSRVDGL